MGTDQHVDQNRPHPYANTIDEIEALRDDFEQIHNDAREKREAVKQQIADVEERLKKLKRRKNDLDETVEDTRDRIQQIIESMDRRGATYIALGDVDYLDYQDGTIHLDEDLNKISLYIPQEKRDDPDVSPFDVEPERRTEEIDPDETLTRPFTEQLQDELLTHKERIHNEGGA